MPKNKKKNDQKQKHDELYTLQNKKNSGIKQENHKSNDLRVFFISFRFKNRPVKPSLVYFKKHLSIRLCAFNGCFLLIHEQI